MAFARLRRHTLVHGAQMSAMETPPPKAAAAMLLTQMDGSLIPIVTPAAHGADRRKGKQLHWREARLCLAREKESATATCGATPGNVGVAGALWRQTACAAGLGENTRVHGVGDGADWLTTQFGEQFGGQGQYLLDFWHVSEHLGAAGQRDPTRAGSDLAATPARAAPGKQQPRRAARPGPACGTGEPGGSPCARGGNNWTAPARAGTDCPLARAKWRAATGM